MIPGTLIWDAGVLGYILTTMANWQIPSFSLSGKKNIFLILKKYIGYVITLKNDKVTEESDIFLRNTFCDTLNVNEV